MAIYIDKIDNLNFQILVREKTKKNWQRKAIMKNYPNSEVLETEGRKIKFKDSAIITNMRTAQAVF
jgi:hypothetical protein